jgi:5-amino-6-(5-phospho-D-ribitylamino)uracil phosphatase
LEVNISNHYKLLVLDIDGTLLNKAGTISAADRLALDNIRNAGIQVSLCTGRVITACTAILEELSLDGYHIFFDGALVYNHKLGREICSWPIPPEVVRKACEVSLSDRIPLDLFSSTRYFVTEESWRSDIRRKFFKIGSATTDFKDLWRKEKIIKGGIVTSSPEEESQARSYITKLEDCLNFTWTMTPAYPDYRFINIVDIRVSKGKALEALASHLGLGMEEVAAIGDGSNDVSLLATAGLAIAMRNSPAELKSVADHITGDVEQSGVAQAIYKFFLI